MTPADDMQIVPATSEDVPALEALARECELTVDFGAELARSYARLWVARLAGTVVGFLLAWRAADELHLTDLGVTREARRRGVGASLLGELCRDGARSGASMVLLEVRESNAPARALYEKFGFAELDRRARYYADTGEDAVVMQLKLG